MSLSRNVQFGSICYLLPIPSTTRSRGLDETYSAPSGTVMVKANPVFGSVASNNDHGLSHLSDVLDMILDSHRHLETKR